MSRCQHDQYLDRLLFRLESIPLMSHLDGDHQKVRPRHLGVALLVCAWLAVAIAFVAGTGAGAHASQATGPESGVPGSTGNGSLRPSAGAAGGNGLASSDMLRSLARAEAHQLPGFMMGVFSGQGAGSPPVNWSVPGAVIKNLDAAAGSPYGPGRDVVALTFDDGPSPVYTPQILHVLLSDQTFASFEIVGEHGADNVGILHQEVADGMVLVNHTWSHVDLNALPAAAFSVQLDETDALLQSITGHTVRCLRPPAGHSDPAVLTQLTQRGLAELSWDIDPSDYLKPPASVIAQRVLSALHPGAIIVLHDGGGDRSQTVAALPSIISGIRSAGYQIVPVCGG
jgi:peptidoglycan/xylan/chitin deacetylase (PgdA/CDA1 family)